ncbi:tetratricopeptide repeat protein [Streptomyces marincola]|uniref:tetratricopeptide repeat protein n=1 Tax=Streptomyces marincola TaxID=2878388 RepID=UPI00384AF5AA
MTGQTVTEGTGRPAFLGRRSELATLRSDVARAGLDTMAGRPVARARVLLIAGRPGSGRTALAEEFAAEVVARGDHPDGVLRARLTEPGGAPVPLERVARELLTELGEDAPPGADEGELCDILREALDERRAVLLLDDVGTAGQLAELIPDRRDCLVIAVSRGPLPKVPDVRPCTIGALDRAAAVALLERGAGDVRVTVDPGAAETLAELCGYQPAALVLVAGWLAARPDATLAEVVRLFAAGPEPEAGPVAGPEREAATGPGAAGGSGSEDAAPREGPGAPRGRERPAPAPRPGFPAPYPPPPAHPPPDAADEPLRRAFRLVTGTLPAPAVRALRLLVLAPAGLVDAHTAAALAGCPVSAARTALAGFAAAGLLRPLPPASGGGVGAQYLVPGCLDALLRAQLHATERPAEILLARARMLERTVRLLRACHAVTEPQGSAARVWLAGLPGALRFPGRAEAAAWLTARRTALLAAARLAVADGQLDTLARRLVSALSRALIAHRGAEAAAPDLYRLHELVLGVAERQHLARERAAALLNLGDIDAGAGRPAEALERYRAALEAARSEGDQADPLAVGRTLESIAGTYAELDDWQRAADWYSRAVTLAQSRGDLKAQARLHGRVAAAFTHTGQWPEALRAWRAAAAAHRRTGDARAHARAVAETARAQEHAGRAEEAARTAREALRLAERAGDVRLQAAVRLRLADGCERAGRTSAAAAHRAAAEALLAPAPRARSGAESSGVAEGSGWETQPQKG